MMDGEKEGWGGGGGGEERGTRGIGRRNGG